ALGAIPWRTPTERRAQRFARYGIRCGGNRWSRPCRGRKATRRPATSPITIGSLGIPNGVSTTTSSTASRNLYRPEPPMTAIAASALSAGPGSAGPALACAGPAMAGPAPFEADGDEELLEEEEDEGAPEEPLATGVFLSPPLSRLLSEDDPESGPELDAPSPAFPFAEASAGSAAFWSLRLSVR